MDPASPVPAPDAPAGVRTANEWFQVLYHELRRRARGELFRHQAFTLGATTLLHEVWLQMGPRELQFASQDQLIAYAARAMRGIVIDHLRARRAGKRGGGLEPVTYETQEDLRALSDGEVLELADALDSLAAEERELAELVELKFFAGLTFAEIASLRQVSERTVQRDWEKARAYLHEAMRR